MNAQGASADHSGRTRASLLRLLLLHLGWLALCPHLLLMLAVGGLQRLSSNTGEFGSVSSWLLTCLVALSTWLDLWRVTAVIGDAHLGTAADRRLPLGDLAGHALPIMKDPKRNRFRHVPWLPATALLTALAFTSCSDQGEPLPGGYFIFIASSSEMFLNEPTHGGSIPQLGTDLEEIGNHKEYIFGRSGSDRGATPGYFLLNTKTGSIKTGLVESNWLGLTAAAGIPNPPELVNPARKSPRRR